MSALTHANCGNIANVSDTSCELQAAKVVATMVGHNDRVNCVEWLPTPGTLSSCIYCHVLWHWCKCRQHKPCNPHKVEMSADGHVSGVLASGSADNHVLIWLSHPDDPDKPWSVAARLQVTLHHASLAISVS